ncbi:hypothetical protein DIPPA_18548 [Diplonema papillatum]|nr:hypothetical protein DIPPA_18548 [Diplonema papillatum]|eukprot:gene10109-15542_t
MATMKRVVMPPPLDAPRPPPRWQSGAAPETAAGRAKGSGREAFATAADCFDGAVRQGRAAARAALAAAVADAARLAPAGGSPPDGGAPAAGSTALVVAKAPPPPAADDNAADSPDDNGPASSEAGGTPRGGPPAAPDNRATAEELLARYAELLDDGTREAKQREKVYKGRAARLWKGGGAAGSGPPAPAARWDRAGRLDETSVELLEILARQALATFEGLHEAREVARLEWARCRGEAGADWVRSDDSRLPAEAMLSMYDACGATLRRCAAALSAALSFVVAGYSHRFPADNWRKLVSLLHDEARAKITDAAGGAAPARFKASCAPAGASSLRARLALSSYNTHTPALYRRPRPTPPPTPATPLPPSPPAASPEPTSPRASNPCLMTLIEADACTEMDRGLDAKAGKAAAVAAAADAADNESAGGSTWFNTADGTMNTAAGSLAGRVAAVRAKRREVYRLMTLREKELHIIFNRTELTLHLETVLNNMRRVALRVSLRLLKSKQGDWVPVVQQAQEAAVKESLTLRAAITARRWANLKRVRFLDRYTMKPAKPPRRLPT